MELVNRLRDEVEGEFEVHALLLTVVAEPAQAHLHPGQFGDLPLPLIGRAGLGARVVVFLPGHDAFLAQGLQAAPLALRVVPLRLGAGDLLATRALQDAGQGGRGRTGGPGQGHRPPGDNKPQEVDSKEIQRKIQETQARLAGGRGSKGNKGKYRRDKRELMADRP